MSDTLKLTLAVTASLFYAATTVGCLTAAIAAHGERKQSFGTAIWWIGAVLFTLLALSRLRGWEADLQSDLRDILLADGVYAGRRVVQTVLVSTLVVFNFSLTAALLFRFRKVPLRIWAGDPRRWAMAGMIAMAGLVGLRIVSLHATDALLYGPLHLNWFIDIGATLLVLVAALRFRRSGKGSGKRGER